MASGDICTVGCWAGALGARLEQLAAGKGREEEQQGQGRKPAGTERMFAHGYTWDGREGARKPFLGGPRNSGEVRYPGAKRKRGAYRSNFGRK